MGRSPLSSGIALAGLMLIVAAGPGFGQTGLVIPKTPHYLDCHSGKIVIYPGEQTVSPVELEKPGNPVEQLLDQVTSNATSQSVIVMVRPGSVKVYR